MYIRHFALTRWPFEASVPADALFGSAAIAEAEARIRHLVELRGIGLLTGEVGCGKTTACRRVADSLNPGSYRLCYVALSTGSALDTCNTIAGELGLAPHHSRAGAWSAIRTQVSRLVAETRQLPVLILDEAHHLRSEVLEDLRLLCNFVMDSEARLCLLFVGLSELRRRLDMAAYESLAQRLVIRHHMAGLERDEIEPYLQHRLAAAGAPADRTLFEPAAVEALFLAANGMPRQVNRLAHYALAAAAVEEARLVTAEHVRKATLELSA